MTTKGNKGKGRTASMLIMALCIVVFIFALYKIGSILHEYKEASDLYEECEDSYFVPSKIEYSEGPEREIFTVDFEKLKDVNTDVIGWIYIPNTSISYPVLKCKDNNQYLYQSYKKQYLTAGSIFLDYRCTSDLEDDSTVIYGHNMKDGSMFGSLKKYKDEKYFKSHEYMYIFKDDDTVNVYKATSNGKADIWGETYELPKKQTEKENQIVLSTCTGDGNYDYRYIVVYDFVENVPKDEAKVWKTSE